MKAPAFGYERAHSVEEALLFYASGDEDAKYLAGGQSLGPLLNLRLARPSMLIDVRSIDELRECTQTPDGLVIGAGVTHAAIEDGAVPGPVGAFLAVIAHGIAYRAVRNRGTLGGSLAHADPAADWVSTMALLDAQLDVRGVTGERQVPAESLVEGPLATKLAPDELVVSVHLPGWSAAARFSYYKFNRKPGEFADAIAGFAHDPERGVCRAVIGATDGPPAVIADARELLASAEASEAAVTVAGFEPGSFEHHVHAVALRRARDRLIAR
jgi:carbon-monoxide dehydrogenase medium subunit